MKLNALGQLITQTLLLHLLFFNSYNCQDDVTADPTEIPVETSEPTAETSESTVETSESASENAESAAENSENTITMIGSNMDPSDATVKPTEGDSNLSVEVVGGGPKESDDLHRLGETCFYIFQNEEGTNMVDWDGAKDMCEKAGMKLAKIDDLSTDVLVSRELEKFIRYRGWINNWYWMDAKFDRSQKTYVWQDTMTPLNFSHFYYRSPRPKGYGDFFNNDGEFISEPTVEHCLAFSMPLPFPKTHNTPGGLVHYPFHTSWWERRCDSAKKGNVLCQFPGENCRKQRGHSIFTEATGNYYEHLWPMSNRRFVVSWSAKSLDEAKSFCEENKMKLYSPHEEDTCLSKSLKNWMKTVTSYSFWTDAKYNVKEKKFIYPDKSEVPEAAHNVSVRFKREAETEIEETCASLTWNYEEFPKNINFCNCTLSSVVLSPENCLNKIGVICQPKDEKERPCTEEYYETALPPDQQMTFNSDAKHPKITEFYPFNSNPDWPNGIIRSGYKQLGTAGQCQKGYKRVSANDTYWGTEEDFENSNHIYDFLTPYWMKAKNGTCRLSTVTWDAEAKKLNRELTEENCNQWLGFVLCKKKPDAKGRRLPSAIDPSDPKHVAEPH